MTAESLSDRALRLGAGSLLFALGIALVFTRMSGDWAKGVLLLVLLIPFLLTIGLLRMQLSTGDTPTALVSLLSGLAFLFAAASVLQFADILVSNPGPWTQTWSHW
jgi:hypothetical protein